MRKLYRSRTDRKLFGICGGLAESMNVDPTVLRLVVVVTTFFTGGTTIPVYLIASLVIPKEPFLNPPMYGSGGAYGAGGYGGGYGSAGAYGASSGPSTYSTGYPTGGAGSYPGGSRPQPQAAPAPQQSGSAIDEMMKDVEKKALYKELEELRAKVAKLEKEEK